MVLWAKRVSDPLVLPVPPLRQRPADILPMANHFLNNISRFYNEPPKTLSSQVQRLLLEYPWPGNARQLANAIERAYVMTNGPIIETEALPPDMLIEKRTKAGESSLLTLDAAKERLITEVLQRTKGQKTAAAKILGIDRRQLSRIIEKLNIEVTQPRTG
jgi:DNA-binding NtrC family response regulator